MYFILKKSKARKINLIYFSQCFNFIINSSKISKKIEKIIQKINIINIITNIFTYNNHLKK